MDTDREPGTCSVRIRNPLEWTVRRTSQLPVDVKEIEGSVSGSSMCAIFLRAYTRCRMARLIEKFCRTAPEEMWLTDSPSDRKKRGRAEARPRRGATISRGILPWRIPCRLLPT